jgi:protein-tyrosine phosphatase
LYCEECHSIKNESVHEISHLFDNLYLSGIIAAAGWDGHRLYVHEDSPHYKGHCIHIPILTKKPNSMADRNGAMASPELLNDAADVIEDHVNRYEPLLVHCKGGVERSPLAVVWYLVRSGKYESYDAAYEFVKSKRKVVSNRLFWL